MIYEGLRTQLLAQQHLVTRVKYTACSRRLLAVIKSTQDIRDKMVFDRNVLEYMGP